ncbi:hypothetical protein ACOACO_11640 [Nocardioides sp. CPCC 205120]|uniref:hypothetical protein n=1 Tax=Nocardioides sp. CPCC 205120 TaxID=3406462 RepID=UPI003B512F39
MTDDWDHLDLGADDPADELALLIEGGFEERWVRTGPPGRLLERTVGPADFLGGDLDRAAATCALAVRTAPGEPSGATSTYVVVVLVQDEPPTWSLAATDVFDDAAPSASDAARRAVVEPPWCWPVHNLLADGVRVDLLRVALDVVRGELGGRELGVGPHGTIVAVGPPTAVLTLRRADGAVAWSGTLDQVDLVTHGEAWTEADLGGAGGGGESRTVVSRLVADD